MLTVSESNISFCKTYDRLSESLSKTLKAIKAKRVYKIKTDVKISSGVIDYFKLDLLDRQDDFEIIKNINNTI
jgi:hypothetical protein